MKFSYPRTEMDSVLLVTAVFLLLAGTVIIYSTSAVSAHSNTIFGHLIHMAVGFFVAMIGWRVDYHKWESKLPWIMLLTLFLLILVAVPGIGHEVKGGRRWLRVLGFGFQPSEFLKVVLIFYTASYLTRKQKHLDSFIKGLVPNLTIMGIYLALVLVQPDFGTVVLISLTLLLMIYVGGGKPLHVFGSLFVFSLFSVFLILSNAYRVRRLMAFMDPWNDPLDSGFQIIQSLIAIGSGGIWGKGLGEGRQKLQFLPDAHTDFIFSIWGEELGYIGVWILIFMFAVLIWRGYLISYHARSSFGRYVAFGITTCIALQVILNLFVVTGLIPTKGLPLPFISSGGSSLIVTLLMTGILLNISQSQPPP